MPLAVAALMEAVKAKAVMAQEAGMMAVETRVEMARAKMVREAAARAVVATVMG